MSAKVTAILALEMQDNATAKLKQASENFQKTTEQTSQKIQLNYKNIAFGATSVATGIVSFATSFDSLNRSALTAEKAQLSYEKAQKRVNDLLKAGKSGTEEYRLANETARLAQEKASLAQDAYSDKVLNFAVGIAPQFISMGVGVQTMLKDIGITSLAQIPKILGFGATHTTTMGAVRGSTTIATFSMHGLAAGIRAVISAHPIIFIALTALSVLITLVATNTFGLRDAFVNLGKFIFEFIDQHLKPLADLLRFLNDNAIQPITIALGIGVPDAAEKASEGFDNTARSAGKLSQTLDPTLNTAIGKTTTSLSELILTTSNLSEITFGTQFIPMLDLTTVRFEGVATIIERNIEKFGAMGRTALQAGEETTQASAKTVVGLSAIEQVLKRIQELQESQTALREQALNPFNLSTRVAQGSRGAIFGGSAADIRSRERFGEVGAIEDQIAQLTRMAQSLALATGQVSPLNLFGGSGFRLGGLTFSPDFMQAVTDFGTLISRWTEGAGGTPLRPGVDISITDAILRGLGNFDIGGVIERLSGSLSPQARFNAFHPIYNPTGRILTREEFFGLRTAQHGFEGFVDKPTLFLTGEAGREHVSITPKGRSGSDINITFKIVVDRSNRLLRIEDEVTNARLPLLQAKSNPLVG